MPTTTSPPPKDAPSALDVSGDFRNLRTHGAASLGELKEFLDKLRRKSPQEVIGIVSSSLLIQSVVIATVITVAFMAVFTVGPFLLMGPPKTKPAQAPAAAVAPVPVAGAADAAKATPTKGDKTAGPSEEDAAKAVKAMGMDEVKSADPKSNPLEKDFDKLLDGAK